MRPTLPRSIPFTGFGKAARRRLVVTLCLTWLAALGSSAAGPSAHGAEAEFRVVVHPQNALSSTTRDFLTEAFLKKTAYWSDGQSIRPVDLRPDSATRRIFTENVLRRSVAAVRSYWQQRIFSGRGVPPPELDSDEDVIAYVQKHEGAVGYVSSSARLNQVKVLVIR